MGLVGYGSESDSGDDGQLLDVAPKTVSLKKDVPVNPVPVGDATLSEPGLKRKNIITGYAEESAFDDATFKIQNKTFDMLGFARDPATGRVIGSVESAEVYGGRDVTQLHHTKSDHQRLRAKRQKKGDASILEGQGAYKGPWAKYDDEKSDSDSYDEDEVEEEQEEEEAVAGVDESEIRPAEPIEPSSKSEPDESTEFHGKSLYDYQGRTYMHVPRDLGIDLFKEFDDIEEWYVPKKRIHSWAGHAGGVNKIKFFPRHGHLLLSCGNDSKVKLWDVYHDRSLLRSYSGHSRAIKDIDFNPEGSRFLSSAYDKYTKLWDTETGQCISRFTTGKMHNCVRFNPREPHSFVVGTANNKIVQYDTRDPANIVQEYDHHLGAVNSITFVDDNLRFMTTSDDKTVRVWEWQINVPIKFIADPSQHSMPSVALHPEGKYVAAQSLDNRIVVIGATDKFRMSRRKQFTGYSASGYAIGMDFSPDGRFLMSGDATGNAIFWNWKTSAIQSKFKAHNGAVQCIAAHPQETSKVATGGIDSKIHYWD